MSELEPQGLHASLELAPWQLDFHQVLRRVAAAFPNLPRPGEASSPQGEPLRLGQDPSFAFAPSAVRDFEPPRADRPGRLRVAFFGLFGPEGPLPGHFTELSLSLRKPGEQQAISAFADLFHHRMLLLLHRAWSTGRPEVGEDRPEGNAFTAHVEALVGAPPSSAPRGVKRPVRLQFARHWMGKVRTPEGLAAVIGGYFECQARIREFVPEWLALPESQRWRLGGCERRALGRSTCTGARAFQRNQKFELELGPLPQEQYRSLLPGTDAFIRLNALVRSHVGPELTWDVKLSVLPNQRSELRLGQAARLGYESWLGPRAPDRAACLRVPAERCRSQLGHA